MPGEEKSDLVSNENGTVASAADEARARKSRRYRMRRYFHCSSPAYGGIHGYMINVSEAGVMIRSESAIDFGQDLDLTPVLILTIVIPENAQFKEEQVQIEVIPVWYSKVTDADQYEVGFKWRHLSAAQRLLIKHWQAYAADAV